MDCTLIQVELVPYQLGALSGEEYDAVEAHLVECKGCLRAYMQVKRHMEQAPARPGEAMRRRLREDVAREFRPARGEAVRRWFARPIPLYQGLAVAAAAALVVSVMPALMALGGAEPASHAPSSPVAAAPLAAPPGAPANPRVDTSRHDAENLAFY